MINPMNTPEILDLVNENDEVIDTLSRDEIYKQGLSFVRVIEAFIKNSKGELWIPIRTLDKKIAPGGLDVGVGGHVEHGETYEQALAKEVKEELGWNIGELVCRQVGKFSPKDGLNTVSTVYEIMSDIAPELNPEDFISAEWLTPLQLAQKITQGHPAKSNILPLLRLVYAVEA
jgi:isopentenyldiphosphate isomerase